MKNSPIISKLHCVVEFLMFLPEYMEEEPTSMSRKFNFVSFMMWYTVQKLLIIFFLSNTFCLISVSSSSVRFDVSYADHCASIVPQSSPVRYSEFLSLVDHSGYYTFGGSDMNRSQSSLYQPYLEFRNSIEFKPWGVEETDVKGLFKVEGTLRFPRDSRDTYLTKDSTNLPQYERSQSCPPRPSSVSFFLTGFWSESSGKLCMVGSGSMNSEQGHFLDVPAVLKLYNLLNFTTVASLISGTLESLIHSEYDLKYFEPISILMLPRMNYQHTLVPNNSDNFCASDRSDVPLSSLTTRRLCSELSAAVSQEFDLKYLSHCKSGTNCAPFSVSSLLRVVSMNIIECSEDTRRLRVLVVFADSNNVWYQRPFNPNTTLVGEGSWDTKKTQLQVVACRFLNGTDSLTDSIHVDDCSIKMSLRFPATLTIGNTSKIVGKLWSTKTVTELHYFESVAFESPVNIRGTLLPGMKYEYSKIDRAIKLCPRKKSSCGMHIYPPAGPFTEDLSFYMSFKKFKERFARGRAVPVFVGDRFYKQYWCSEEVPASSGTYIEHSGTPVSYRISIISKQFGDGFPKLNTSSVSNKVQISAEGIYDDRTGSLCMVGCRNLGDDYVDCEILLNFQLPQTNQPDKSLRYVKGAIQSTRKKFDALYFEPLDLSSDEMDMTEADGLIWIKNVEITLNLISIILACIFVASQLIHVRKHPDMLPSISLLTPLTLSLGHMIPLKLNIEAIFTHATDRHNVFLRSSEWLQITQENARGITVITTVVALLLHFRLLQQIWSARSAKGTFKLLWDVEKKALPVYAAGVLTSMLLLINSGHKGHPILSFKCFRAHAGLVLDGFLLPQILLNMVCNSKERVLSLPFYIGTTFVHVLPYACDFYRSDNYVEDMVESCIHATPIVVIHSTSWVVTSRIGGLPFAAIIFLQQRFGGLFFIPQKFRVACTYIIRSQMMRKHIQVFIVILSIALYSVLN